MARISYLEEKDHPELAGLIGKIKGVRGSLINIYKLLLHSPAIAATWFEHINATRKTKLSGRHREIAIVRIASVARYAYALNQHVPKIATAEGLSLQECEALKDWCASGKFDERERALLTYVDTMLAGPEMPDDVFNGLRKHLGEQEVVELTVIVGTYLMHNRVFTALRVDLEPKQS
jgi:4-carboxymuconolactone decarboxylase